MALPKFLKKINDAVNITEDQTIDGAKTFNISPKISTPTEDSDNTSAINIEYLENNLKSLNVVSTIVPVTKSYVYGKDITSNSFTLEKGIYNMDFNDKILYIAYNGILLDGSDYTLQGNNLTINSDNMTDGDSITVCALHTVIEGRVKVLPPTIITPIDDFNELTNNKIVITTEPMNTEEI